MLKSGYLAGTNFYASTSHTTEIIQGYLIEFEQVIDRISDCKNDEELVNLIDGPLCHSGFERLN